MSNRTRFTDDFRAKAVALAIAAGYPKTKGALSRVAGDLKISHQVLRNWIIEAQNPPPQELLQEKKAELRDLIKTELAGIMARLPEKRNDATYRELGTVFGIMFDKLQLLDELPTQIIGLTSQLKKIAEAAEAQGIDMEMLFNNLLAEVVADKADIDDDDD